jgi:hypothetical protein
MPEGALIVAAFAPLIARRLPTVRLKSCMLSFASTPACLSMRFSAFLGSATCPDFAVSLGQTHCPVAPVWRAFKISWPEFAPALVEHLHTVASSSLLRRRVRRFGSGRDTSAAGLSCFRPAALRIAPRNTTSFPAVLTLPFFIAADFAASMSLASISKAAFVGSSWPQSSR